MNQEPLSVDEDEEGEDEDEKREMQRLVKVNINKIHSLEDLYTAFPCLGDGSGQWKLRVERLQPRMVQGHNILGVIGDTDTKFSIEDMESYYGGGKYTVAVIGPIGRRTNEDGSPRVKELKKITIDIPGPPKLTQFGDEFMSARMPVVPGQYNTVVPQGPMPQTNPQVQMKQLEIDERRESRSQETNLQAYQASADAAKHALIEVKEMAAAQLAEYRKRLDTLSENNSKKEDEIRRINEMLAKETANAVSMQRLADDMRSNKERIESDLHRIKDDARRLVEDAVKQHQVVQDEQRRRFDEDRARIERESQSERERIREESRLREQMLRDETERRISHQKDSYESRIFDLIRQTDRDIANTKEQRDREIASMSQSTKVEVSSIKSSADTRLGILESERTRLISENDRLQKRFEELRRESAPKDTMTTIREATELAGMVGMVPAGTGSGGGEDEGPFDWKKTLAKGVMQAIEKAPEAMAQLGAIRNQNAAIQQQQQQQQQMQQLQQQARRPRMMPPQPAQANWAAQQGSPLQQGIPGIIAPVRSASSLRPAYQPAPHAPVSMSPLPQEQPAMPPMEMYQQPMAPIQSTTLATSERPSFPPSAPGAELQITEENLLLFIAQLDKAIREDIVPPTMFAQQFFQMVGPDTTRILLERISPEKLFELAEQADTSITTRDGQAYVRKVWAAAKTLLG